MLEQHSNQNVRTLGLINSMLTNTDSQLDLKLSGD